MNPERPTWWEQLLAGPREERRIVYGDGAGALFYVGGEPAVTINDILDAEIIYEDILDAEVVE